MVSRSPTPFLCTCISDYVDAMFLYRNHDPESPWLWISWNESNCTRLQSPRLKPRHVQLYRSGDPRTVVHSICALICLHPTVGCDKGGDNLFLRSVLLLLGVLCVLHFENKKATCSSFLRRSACAGPGCNAYQRLTCGQLDKLVIAQLGFLAQKRLARGVKLNHSEACVGRLSG